MQMVQKIRNAVAEKENFVIFRDVLKDSNSQKIAGKKNNSRRLDLISLWIWEGEEKQEKWAQAFVGPQQAAPTNLETF